MCLVSVFVSVLLRQCDNHTERIMNAADTVIYKDTIPYYLPVPKDSIIIRYIAERLPIVIEDTSEHAKDGENYAHNSPQIIPDSVDVVIPIEQKEYEDSIYHLWISGYNAQLDSIKVYRKKLVITNTILRENSNHWHIGLTAGYGMGKNGLTPYVGVGVTYSLFSFGK